VQTRTRNAIVLAVTGAAIAAALASVARTQKTPVLRPQIEGAIPSGALLVATADLAALKSSPVGAPFLREGREIQGLGKVRDVCGFDPIDALTEAAIAIPSAGDAGEFGLVAVGTVDDEAVIGCASKVISARGGNPVVTTIGSFRSVRDATLAVSGGEIAARKGGPLLLGAGTYLRSMIDAADGRTPTIRSSRAHAALGREIAGDSVRVTVVLSHDQRRTLVEELSANGEKGSPMASIAGGALGVKIGPTVAVHGLVSCDDAAACERLAGAIGKARDARAGDPLLRLVGVGALLEKIAIEPRGELVHARVEMPAEQAALLAERLLSLRGAGRRPPQEETPARRPLPPDEVIKATPTATATPSATVAPSASAAPAPKAP
jgi:hypothetical protein